MANSVIDGFQNNRIQDDGMELNQIQKKKKIVQ